MKPPTRYLLLSFTTQLRQLKPRRQMKTSSKMARKAKLQKIYEAAETAERAGDPFRMYQAIRSLAPKQTFHRITLRSSTGEMLGPEQAADQLCNWFRQLYSDEHPNEEACTFTLPFTITAFQKGLEQLPLAKALDPQYAPAPFWIFASSQGQVSSRSQPDPILEAFRKTAEM